MRQLKILWQLMRGFRAGYAASIAAMVVGTTLFFAVPSIFGIAIDNIIGEKPYDGPAWIAGLLARLGGRGYLAQHLWWAGLAVVGLTLVAGCFGFLRGRWSAQSTENIARRLRRRLFDHLHRLPVQYHATADTGDLVQRCTSDVETIRRFLAGQVVEIGRASIMLALAIPIVWMLDPRMMLLSLCMTPVLIGFAVYFFPRVRDIFKAADEAEGALTTVIQENLTGIRVVRAFARQDFEEEKFAGRNDDHCRKGVRLTDMMAIYWSISDLISIMQMGLILVCGGWFILGGTLTVGKLVTIQTMVGMMLWPVRQMGRILTDLGKAMVAIDRVQEILTAPAETDLESPADERGAALAPLFAGAIEFEGVSFGYRDEAHVLHGIDLTIAPGETLALIGHSGSGKSTLIRLLLRLYDPREGTIRVGGRDIATLSRQGVRSHVGVVMQQPFLFSKTVRENIAIGRGDAPQHDIEEAASASCIHEAIVDFEHGYDTEIGERGVRLSGGQRQRMAIARALLTEPPVMVLDDALSAVDTQTEDLILRALEQRRARQTTILIAHRLSTLRLADRVAVLDHGRIAQLGTHGELIGVQGLYRKLWAIQGELQEELSIA